MQDLIPQAVAGFAALLLMSSTLLCACLLIDKCLFNQDPTGSIGAGIHSNVFQAEEGVNVGAVMILQQAR